MIPAFLSNATPPIMRYASHVPRITPTRACADVSLAVITGACSDDPVRIEPAAPGQATAAVASAAPRGSSRRTLDEELTAVAAEAPGFGGFIHEPGGRVSVFVTEQGSPGRVKAALARFFARNGRQLDTAAVSIRLGQYDFGELHQAYGRLRAALPAHGITQTEIDEAANRIRVGVLDDAAAGHVRHALQRAGFALEMVVIQPIPATVIAASNSLNTGSAIRPLPGGMGILAPNGCTAGYNVRLVNAATNQQLAGRYMVTNSHCTVHFGVKDSPQGAEVWQGPSYSHIGREHVDPPLFTNAALSRCRPNRLCRWSDAVLIQYADSVLDEYGSIAKSNGVGSNTVVDRYSIVGQEDAEYIRIVTGGQPVPIGKMGNTTGFTSHYYGAPYGSGTCVDVTQYNGQVDTGRDMLCQDQAFVTSDGGDSGAPVFTFGPSGYVDGANDAVLLGVNWGWGRQAGNPSAPSMMTWSPAAQVSDEIGATLEGRSNAARATNIRLRACSFWCP